MIACPPTTSLMRRRRALKRRGSMLLALMLAMAAAPQSGLAAGTCSIGPGFAALRDQMQAMEQQDVAGDCVENEHAQANGDAIQRTTNGVFHWRKSDNSTRFTSPSATWTLDGQGIRLEPNTAEGYAAADQRLMFAPGIAYLFVAEGESVGTEPDPGTDGGLKVTLTNPNQTVLWFSDHPQRLSGHKPLSALVDAWDTLGFGQNPPNAALAVPGAPESRDTLLVKMLAPTWDAQAKSLTFKAVPLTGDAAPSPGLDWLRARADGGIASGGRTLLFIDSGEATAGAAIIDGIALAATCGQAAFFTKDPSVKWYNGCDNRDLHGVDMSGGQVGGGPWVTVLGIKEHTSISTPQFHSANLTGANLSRTGVDDTGPKSAMFNFATLENANLSQSKWGGSQFMNAKAHGANFRGSDLTSANFYGADLTGADFTGATLIGAQFVNADLTGAIMHHADISRSNWTGAKLNESLQQFLEDLQGYTCHGGWTWTNGLTTFQNCP